ncbi:MAG: alanine racemase [Gammaproteobacteria bacterium]|nr:alanine racemase [Gammaproteobacteria bacterium]
MRRTEITLDLGALRHNLLRLRAAAPASRVMAAIKANGYGHGMERVARTLAEVDALGVACLEEAVRLREAGITTPITLLEGFFHADELPVICQHALDVVIHHAQQIAILEQRPPSPPLRVWLKVDSGMHRLGVPADEARAQWQRLAAISGVVVNGVMTHLANADDLKDASTVRQLNLFHASCEGLPGERTIANSAGLLGWPQSHAEWNRPGIALYGVSPFVGGRAAEHGLRPVMTLRSELIAVNRLRQGDAIGYGGSWRCPEAMAVGVVAVGYGDGYPRHAVAGTPVLLNGRRVPLVGRVSMDMLTVDLRGQPEASIGDGVVLWGEGLPVEEIAEHATTIPYELLCGVTGRVRVIERG